MVRTAEAKKKSIKSGKSRLGDLFVTKLRDELKQKLGMKNSMEVPKISKIVLNVGVKEAVADSRVLEKVEQTLAVIAGQAPVRTKARKSIASFKIREGMPLGVCVTLRGRRMYDFLDKMINLALPRVRDFQGVARGFDGQGNYNLGIRDWTIFPEVDSTGVERVHGLNVTVATTTKNDEHAYELLQILGVPFKKK